MSSNWRNKLHAWLAKYGMTTAAPQKTCAVPAQVNTAEPPPPLQAPRPPKPPKPLPQQPDIPPTDIVLVPQERDGVLMAADTVLGVTPGQHRSLRSELKAAGVRPPPKGFVVRPLAVPFHREGDRTWWMMFACPQAVDDPECNKLVIERMSRDLHRVADQVLLHGILPPPLTHSSLTRDIWAAIAHMPGRDFFATRAGHKYKYRVLWNDPASGRSTGPRLAICYGGHVFIKNDRRLEVVLGKPALALRKKGQS